MVSTTDVPRPVDGVPRPAAGQLPPGRVTRPWGWYLVALDADLTGEITPVALGEERLILVRRGGTIRAFDATCPHRGAHLGAGGVLVRDNAIRCPFHGYNVRLGGPCDGQDLSVAEYPVAHVAGLILVNLAGNRDNGCIEHLTQLAQTHVVVPALTMTLRCPMTTVIENAVDRRHFHAVHGIRTGGFLVDTDKTGALRIESTFLMPTAPHHLHAQWSPVFYRALIFSPGIVSVELGGAASYSVITGAVDQAGGGCVIRLIVAFPLSVWKQPPPPEVQEMLFAHSRQGVEDDRAVWESLRPGIVPRWMKDDDAVLRFHDFIRDGGT